MPDSSSAKAVFLSYTREDAEAARRLADALRAFGVEVWFDQNELRGGDAWDAKIREQIRTCARFVPIISAATQARAEGYFRREWKLAADRTHDMATGVPFILPVIIDDTKEGEAAIPDEFRRVQVTRLPQGVPTTQFIDLVKRTLAPAHRSASGAKIAEHDSGPELKRQARWRWIKLGAAVAVVLLAAGAWYFKSRPAAATTPVVVLMDSTYADRVYDPVTLKSGGSNADDITDLLHDLPVALVKEATSSVWRRESEVIKEQPALIIIHRSAFYTFPENRADELYPLADNKLAAFMGYVAAQSPRTRFIVYSRHSWEVDAQAAKWRNDVVSRFPQLAGKIETWRVPLDRPTFRNPLTALELRKTVEQTLGLQAKLTAP
ncbi:MAG: toll/interleukin-1 receptor domain-containing protein [Verrucomicrobia bacterium]|nr:toll/interleukin-1 receptor domain-containing protein [Verrucomicrobiota bacterium]